MLSVYEGILVCALGFELFVCYLALGAVSKLKNAYDLIVVNGEKVSMVPFTDIEVDIARRVDKIFFGASSKCAKGQLYLHSELLY